MHPNRPENSSIDIEHAPATERERIAWPRVVLSAVLPPLAACVAEWFLPLPTARWSLFYPAVFLSAWLGGFWSGIASTALSTMLAWWFFVPPEATLFKDDPKQHLAAFLFVTMGIVGSVLQGRLRRLNVDAAQALADSRRTSERLRQVADERRVLAALIENSSDFIAVTDINGRVTYINPAGRRMIDIAPDFPVETTHVPDFYPKELRQFAAAVTDETRDLGRWQGETELRSWQSEKTTPVSVIAFTIRDPDTNRVLGMGTITRDISAVKHARDELEAANARLANTTRELQENQRFLTAVMEHSPSGVVIKDLDGRYLIANPRLQELLGGGEVKGKLDYELFPREIAERFRENDRIVRETGAPLVTEESGAINGETRYFQVSKFPLRDENGTVFAICAIWSDITDRKHAEQALQQRETDLQAAQRVAHVGSWSWNPQTEAARWSDELYHIFGQDPSKPPPRLLSDEAHFFTPESRDKLIAAVIALRDEGTPYELEMEIMCPDGSARWLAAKGDAVRDSAGKMLELTGTVQDVTELRHLQQMKEEWTSLIAHDLRQPIGFITMAADFLPELHSGVMNEKERDFTQRISNAAHTLARMVDDLLDLSLLEADRLKLERKWVPPDDLVKESMVRVSHLTRNRRIRVSGERGLPSVFADPMRIVQVVGNLISNAVKYGDPDSEIDIHLKRLDDGIEILVTNHGRGITAEELPRLFSRFTRSQATRGSGVRGMGMGLYIAKGLVHAHGGRLWAESTPGVTTTFHLALPRQAAEQVAA